jgi:hypothetical protein
MEFVETSEGMELVPERSSTAKKKAKGENPRRVCALKNLQIGGKSPVLQLRTHCNPFNLFS